MATTQQAGSTAASASAPDPEVPERARTRTFSPRYERDNLNRYESLSKHGKGALLRREGLDRSLVLRQVPAARLAARRPINRSSRD